MDCSSSNYLRSVFRKRAVFICNVTGFFCICAIQSSITDILACNLTAHKSSLK